MKFSPKDPGSAITHFIGWLMALFAAVPLILCACTKPDKIYVISLSIFVISMLLLYAASTLYHSLDINEKVNKRLKKFDHMMISVLIAGTYTGLPHLTSKKRGISPSRHCLGNRHSWYCIEGLLGNLSKMGLLRSLYRNGMDLCTCFYSALKQFIQSILYVASRRRTDLYHWRCDLCSETSDFQQQT